MNKNAAILLCTLISFASGEIIADNVKIILYSKSKGIIYDLANFTSIYNDPEFDKDKPTVLYIHGFTEDRLGFTSKIIVKAFETRNDYNILSCDWGSYSKNFYFTNVVPKLYDIGLVIAKHLESFFGTGYSVCKFHLIGHSLGAQVSGLIGRTLKKKNPSLELCRITGLDPAGPGFYPETHKKFKHISANDAKFVDIIHTDGGVYGADVKTGTVDFFPNGGRMMPGCALVMEIKGFISGVCNHNRAVSYFAESVENPTAFVGVAAKSFQDFKKGKVDGNDVAYMGIDCRKDASSSYFLQTNDQAPFGRAEKGREYNENDASSSNNFLNFMADFTESMVNTRKFVKKDSNNKKNSSEESEESFLESFFG